MKCGSPEGFSLPRAGGVCQGGRVTRDELLHALANLRRARIGEVRAPHKPLLLLWLLGRFAATGSSEVAYGEAEGPVSRMINAYGPPVKNASDARRRAAMPFVHLERELWELRDAHGRPVAHTVAESGPRLREQGATGRLAPDVERLLADPGTLAAATRLLVDLHFTPALEPLILADARLDPAVLEEAGYVRTTVRRRPRRAGFSEQVLDAYGRACAMCGYDGALGGRSVGLEAAHVRWHSQNGPDELGNALALCELHHALFDLGALGLTDDLRVRVSRHYTARSTAGRAVTDLDGRPLAAPRDGGPSPAPAFVAWHGRQVFKDGQVLAA